MVSGILLSTGGLGLFLLGMVVLTEALKSLAGDAARRTLAHFTKTPFSGAVTGAVTTAVIQSSSATTVTAVGFVGAGLLTFKQALGIIFGANLGTTVKGWFFAILGFKLQLGELALPLVFLGVVTHLFTKGRAAAVGLAIAGFALIFVGIDLLQEGMLGLKGFVTPDSFPGDSLGGRMLLVLIGVAMTLVTQSSSAGVATALAAVHAGALTFSQAAAMVIGMDIGTTVTAVLATIGGSTDARRTGMAHVIFNLLTGAGAFCLLTPFAWACTAIAPNSLSENPEIALVAFHTVFNTLGVVLVLPFAGPFARLIITMIRDKPVPFTERLDAMLYESPAMAIEAVRATLKDLAQVVLQQLINALERPLTDEDKTSLNEANQALKRTREYLENVETSADHGSLHPRHLACLHAIDHLRRLIDRCQEVDRAERARQVPQLRPLCAELRGAVTAALVESKDQNSAALESQLKAVWDRFEMDSERYRHDFIQDAAGGKDDAYSTIGKLDAQRWLRRVAYHVWRIVHHLHRSQFDQAAYEPEEMYPHREQDSVD